MTCSGQVVKGAPKNKVCDHSLGMRCVDSSHHAYAKSVAFAYFLIIAQILHIPPMTTHSLLCCDAVVPESCRTAARK